MRLKARPAGWGLTRLRASRIRLPLCCCVSLRVANPSASRNGTCGIAPNNLAGVEGVAFFRERLAHCDQQRQIEDQCLNGGAAGGSQAVDESALPGEVLRPMIAARVKERRQTAGGGIQASYVGSF